MNGAVAEMMLTSATVLRRSALTKQIVAAVEQAAVNSPMPPTERTASSVAPRWRQTT